MHTHYLSLFIFETKILAALRSLNIHAEDLQKVLKDEEYLTERLTSRQRNQLFFLKIILFT